MQQAPTPAHAAIDETSRHRMRERVVDVLDVLREKSVDEETAIRSDIVALARRIDDQPLLVEALLWKNFRLAVRGRPLEAQALRQEARTVALACRDAGAVALCDVNDAGADYASGQLAEAVVKVRRALPMFEGHRNLLRCRIEALLVLLNVYKALRLYDEAAQVIAEGQKIAQASGNQGMSTMFEKFELQLRFERADVRRYLLVGPRLANARELADATESWQRVLREAQGAQPIGHLYAREQLFVNLAAMGGEEEALAVWAQIVETSSVQDIYPQNAAIAELLLHGPQACIDRVSRLLNSPDARTNPSEAEDLWTVLGAAYKRQGDYASALGALRECIRLGLDQTRAVAQARAALFALELDAERDKALAQRALLHTGKLAAVGQLASSVAHEISQPLAALMLLTHDARAMLASQDWVQIDDVVGDIEAQAERLGRLVARMKNFSHDEPLRLQALNLRHVIDEAHRLCKPAIGATQVGFDIDVPDLTVTADKERVVLAVVNLVSNALDAMRAQSSPPPLLRIEARARPGNAREVRLSIIDTGPGLDDAVRARLFQPFFTTKGTGLGLGLTITRQALEVMGARLEGDNEPDRGARFSVVLRGA